MTVRATLVLGVLLVLAALVHGGIYTTGHDFVVNRFTGYYEFVPADDGDEETGTAARLHGSCLKRGHLAATNVALQGRR